MADPIVPSSSAPAAAPSVPATSESNNTIPNQPAKEAAVSATGAKPTPERNPDGTFVKKEAAPAVAAKQEAIARRLKLKVDGRDEELDEGEVIKWAQMGRSAQKRFQEAAAARKQAEDFIKMLKENPLEVLRNPAIGIDVRKFSEEFLTKELQKETLSPEQRRIQELEENLRASDNEKKQREEQQRVEQHAKLQQHFAQDYETKITEALQTSGLPKTPLTVKRMADRMSAGIAAGFDLSPADVVQMVRQDYLTEVHDLFSQTDGDALIKILGDGVANKIRKADLARLKSTPLGGSHLAAPVAKEEPVAKVKEPKDIYEWREMVEKRVKS